MGVRFCPSPWAHPRWRGEHSVRQLGQGSMQGSSPLARGARFGGCCCSAPPGLIPAGAGSTGRWCQPARRGVAHPRWRGEHCMSVSPMTLPRGSSPLARGAQRLIVASSCLMGLIPAGAGSTRRCRQFTSPWVAHPRWRGEHLIGQSCAAPPSGSSPLARGAPAGCCHLGAEWRLIPAGAGSTSCTRRWRSPGRAHPRWRGEHHPDPARRACHAGSSPLARGAPARGVAR